MKWQPIETAPKDGTHILIWDAKGSSSVVEVYWEAFDEERGYWAFAEELLSDVFLVNATPSNWMALPEPPNDATLKEDGE
jgi:hypothetical protein